MRINHKSDFDFRLDLYAADPYGTAVASGFPDCDFTGKLFIGPSTRSRQCYTFSKNGNTLVNCFDSDGRLHVVVSGHNLSTGPLYCELSLRVPDSHYPGGFRSVVYSFPLNIFLTDTDAEQISPTVSVTLPVMQKVIARPPFEDDPTEDGNDNDADNGTEDVVPPSQANARLATPWLSPRVCGGHFRTGAYVGNVYRNDKGRIFLSGQKGLTNSGDFLLTVHIPTLLKLGIEGLTVDNLISKIKVASQQGVEYAASISENNLFLICMEQYFPGYYLDIPQSSYASIDADGKIKYYLLCPMSDYEPTAVSFDELQKHVAVVGSGKTAKICLDFGKTFIFQVWERRKAVSIYKVGRPGFTVWKNLRSLVMKWNTKHRFKDRVSVRPLFFRIARKKHGRVSEWLYFKAYWERKRSAIRLIQTDETGASMTANSTIL